MDMDNLSLAIMKKWKSSLLMVIACLVLELSYQGHAVQGTHMNKETRIVLIGKTGAGKSATGNSILGKKVFKSKLSLSSETRETSYGTTWRFNRKLVVVDTPGLEDTNLSKSKVLMEITKSYTMVSPGPHAFVMLIDSTKRFTNEDEEVLAAYKDYFGKDFRNYLVLVFTHKSRIMEESTLKKFVEEISETHSLRKLIKAIKNRYMAIDYSFNLEDQEEDVLKLLHMIERMKEENNPEFFETKLSSLAERLYSYLSELLGLNEDTSNEEDKREKIRAYILKMFTIYAIQIVTTIAYNYFGGHGITVGYAIIEKLIEYVSIFVQKYPI